MQFFFPDCIKIHKASIDEELTLLLPALLPQGVTPSTQTAPQPIADKLSLARWRWNMISS